MKLIASLKLNTTSVQKEALKATLLTANAACNYISSQAWEHQEFGQYNLHKKLYYTIKDKFTLTAQMAVRCIAKVSDSYKLDKKTQRFYKRYGAIAYDSRILRFFTDRQAVSIWTIAGRLTIPFSCGLRQKELLKFQQGETDLILRNGVFYLLATCNIDTPDPKDVDGILGIDLGIVNIAVDSEGQIFSGAVVNGLRNRHRRLRTRLQSKNTWSAKRLLVKRSGKENRFATDTNHRISKMIVVKAECTNKAIALEDLKGIRFKTKVRRPQRATHHAWSFDQLRQFITYKAQLVGIPIIMVDPRNTSRTCPQCGCVDKRNRVSQSLFSCKKCGFSGPADYLAACNIASRAAVNQPHAA